MKKELPARLVLEAIRYMILEDDMRGGIVRLLRFLEADDTTTEMFKFFDFKTGRATLLAKIETLKHE